MESSPAIAEAIVSASSGEGVAAAGSRVALRTCVSAACDAIGFSTGMATFQPLGVLPYHLHSFSEAITVVAGQACVLVEGRAYLLHARDCIHVPAGVAHRVENPDADASLVAHWAFATAVPTRVLVDRVYPIDNRGVGVPAAGDPETLIRYREDAVYELSSNAFFLDLFARRYGAVGICGGHGRFLPGASLPCHIHDFDESITIVKGTAVCLVRGKRYELSDCATAFIPRGLPHRFLNHSGKDMEMVWVYAGSEPDRRIVAPEYCSGTLSWPGSWISADNDRGDSDSQRQLSA